MNMEKSRVIGRNEKNISFKKILPGNRGVSIVTDIGVLKTRTMLIRECDRKNSQKVRGRVSSRHTPFFHHNTI